MTKKRIYVDLDFLAVMRSAFPHLAPLDDSQIITAAIAIAIGGSSNSRASPTPANEPMNEPMNEPIESDDDDFEFEVFN